MDVDMLTAIADVKQKEKERRRENQKAYYASHKAEKAARCKAYYEAHKEEYKARHKAYWAANKQEQHKHMAVWYEANKEQVRAYQKDYYSEHKVEHYARHRRNGLKSKYGLTVAEWDALFEAQGHKCGICGTTSVGNGKRSWHTDHSHVDNKVRGILCPHCNHMLGNAKDNPDTLRVAAAYLERVGKP
jgi:hypothetical protein